MSALLLVPACRSGGLRYAVRTITGAVTSSIPADLLANLSVSSNKDAFGEAFGG